MLKEFELQNPVNVHSEIIMMGVSQNRKVAWKIALILYCEKDGSLKIGNDI